VVAWQIERAMLKDNITKVEMAERMRTSRAALNRLLDPANDAVTLLTLSARARHWSRAAHGAGARGAPEPSALYGLAAFSMLDGTALGAE
jgi:hypothetical protein